MFILLEYYNDYDQHGGYFVGVFSELEHAEAAVDHIGRVNDEYTWYEIKEVLVDSTEYIEEF